MNCRPQHLLLISRAILGKELHRSRKPVLIFPEYIGGRRGITNMFGRFKRRLREHLAHLLRLGILPTGTILPREHRAVRDLARKRMQLVQSCTAHVLAVENIMARQLGGRMTSNQIKRLTDEAIDSLPMAADVSLAIKANVAVIATLQSQIEVLEKRLQERVKPRPQYRLLTSVPGIGQTLATVILLETGPIDRFADVGNFASYARCVDSVHTSNRKKKGEGNVKNGNRYLA
jgi:transposase